MVEIKGEAIVRFPTEVEGVLTEVRFLATWPKGSPPLRRRDRTMRRRYDVRVVVPTEHRKHDFERIHNVTLIRGKETWTSDDVSGTNQDDGHGGFAIMVFHADPEIPSCPVTR